jgi:hypothetical protein
MQIPFLGASIVKRKNEVEIPRPEQPSPASAGPNASACSSILRGR